MLNFLFLLSAVDWLTLGYYTQISAESKQLLSIFSVQCHSV